jgi:hypothetical protein
VNDELRRKVSQIMRDTAWLLSVNTRENKKVRAELRRFIAVKT